jgi:hypothetical protein
MADSVVIGTKAETPEEDVFITDVERRSGLYALGIQNAGKTTLLKNLIFQDILNGHGVFFLDPHGDAIDDLLTKIPQHRAKDVYILDPTDDTHAFGINLFFCLNPDSLRERSASYAQAEHIFTKLFANPQTQELDILLSQYLPNAFYPLMATEGYTILEIPLLLREKAFRDRLLERSSIPAETLDFWQEEFEALGPHIQREETASTRRRVNLFSAHEYVKHIVGQSETTVDFTKIMDNGKILFVKLSGTLAPRVRDLIGTMLVSNLVQAVLRRERVPEADRRHFCVFVDEFQNFASSEDFAVLFTEGRKYKIATCFAHQERYGQFADNRRIAGATLTAAHLVCFRPSPLDAPVLAQVFPKPSPTKTERERILIISRTPVKDILEGHYNPQVQAFVTEYLRSLADRQEDLKAEMEGERIKRQGLLDAAGSWRAFRAAAERPYNPFGRRVITETRVATTPEMTAMAAARAHSARLLTLFESSEPLRQAMRSLDTFLTGVMEGSIAKGQEAYARCLLEIIAVFFPISRPLALYIALAYGDSTTWRAIPFALAKQYRLFPQAIHAIEQALAEQDRREKEAFLQKERAAYDRKVDLIAEKRAWLKSAQKRATVNELRDGWTPDIPAYISFSTRDTLQDFLTLYLLTREYPQVHALLAPYYTARFAPPWADKYPTPDIRAKLIDAIKEAREENAETREYIRVYKRRQKWAFLTGQEEPHPHYFHDEHYQDVALDHLQGFLEQYGDGAFVGFVLLQTIALPLRERRRLDSMCSWAPSHGPRVAAKVHGLPL